MNDALSTTISVLLIEDEAAWIYTIKFILKELGFDLVATASTVEDALPAIAEQNYDVILLDINLNGANSGLELGKIISTAYQKPYIFITSDINTGHKVTAVAKPSAFLIKPINSTSLYVAIQNAIKNHENGTSAIEQASSEETTFFVKNGSKYKKLDWKDIVYLSAGKNYISIFNSTDKTEYFIRGSLQRTLQTILPKSLQPNYLQINRSEVVHIAFVEELSSSEVKTSYGIFQVSDLFVKELRQRLNIVS